MNNTTKPYTMYKDQMGIIELSKNRSKAFDEYVRNYAAYSYAVYTSNILILDLQNYSVYLNGLSNSSGIHQFDELSEEQKLTKYKMTEDEFNMADAIVCKYREILANLIPQLSEDEKNFVNRYMRL